MDWQELVVIVAIVAVMLGPGYWLFRDVKRHGRNPWIWTAIYAAAVIPPTRFRFILGPAVFAAWFLLRDRSFSSFRSVKRMLSQMTKWRW